VMEKLHGWLEAQFAERKTEPNSGLGKAITYLLRHWKALTTFLREAGAPLDKDYASYCTSCEPRTAISGKRRLSDSLVPWALRGGSGPGSSYRNRFLSLTG
jgi:Transposase IS66 family